MKTIIRKRPNPQNLVRKSLSLSQNEYDIVNNKTLDSEIQVFDAADNELLFTISRKKYAKLEATPRVHKVTGDLFYVVDFSAAV